MPDRWYLELSDAPERSRHKFYEVVVKGAEVHLRWGRIERPGRSHVVFADSPSHARQVARRKVQAKLAKGYERARPGQRRYRAPVPATCDQRQLDIEVDLLARPPQPQRRRRRS